MYNKFIEFLDKHNLYDKDILKYFQSNSLIFDYSNEEFRDFIGCYYSFDKSGRLIKIKACVPYIYDDKTILINIHEYIHFYLLYKKIGKKFIIGLDAEVLPILYEKIYILENPSVELLSYEEYLNNFIIDSDDKKYILALKLQDELINLYNKGLSIERLNFKVKVLARKYKNKI